MKSYKENNAFPLEEMPCPAPVFDSPFNADSSHINDSVHAFTLGI
jgi:hypothetical protein